MATSESDSFVPSTKEYQVLQKYFSILTDAITYPSTLAAPLFATGLISDLTLKKANDETSRKEIRNYHILKELMTGVAKDSTKFSKIISVLQEYPPLLSDIAEDMKTECGNKAI